MINPTADLRNACRMLAKNPGATAVALIVLALGIGANSAIFSIVNALLVRPLPFKEPDRLLALKESSPKRGRESMSVSYPNVADWRDESKTVQAMAAYAPGEFTLTGAGEPERFDGAAISAELFSLLGVQPVRGRDFLSSEDRPGSDVVIISHSLWQQRFGSDREIVEKTLMLDGKIRTIVGVMPPGFKYPETAELWVPIGIDRVTELRGNRRLGAIGRLEQGATLEAARAELETIAARLEQSYPDSNAGTGVVVRLLKDELVRESRPAALILFGAVITVLLIACTNVANLLLVKAAAREREMAIRLALGASRRRLVRQLLTESTVLGLLGGLAGLGVGFIGVKLIVASIPVAIPFWINLEIDRNVIAFTLLISILISLLFGLAPALQGTKPNLGDALKETSNAGSPRRNRLRGTLVVLELAMAIVLSINAGLMIKSVYGLQRLDPGFKADHLLTVGLSLPEAEYAQPETQFLFYNGLLERIAALPNVRSAAAVSNLPLGGSNWGKTFSVEGQIPADEAATPVTSYRVITPNYFAAIGTPVLHGREYDGHETRNGDRLVIINKRMADGYWPGENAVGKRIKFSNYQGNSPWHTIIGVVADSKQDDMNAPINLEAFVSYAQRSTAEMTLIARTQSDPLSLVTPIRAEVAALDDKLPLSDVQTMEAVVAESFWDNRFATTLLAIFAANALILAAVGIYGVISYSAARRTREVGIRMALGAQTSDVLKLILGEAMRLIAIGIIGGLAVAAATTRVLDKLLYGVSPVDPIVFVSIPLLLGIVSLVASYLPALRATRVEPTTALRYE